MRDEKPFFSWLAEPALTGDGPKLVHRDRADCVELTNEVLDGAIERVVAWYDAVEAALIACAERPAGGDATPLERFAGGAGRRESLSRWPAGRGGSRDPARGAPACKEDSK